MDTFDPGRVRAPNQLPVNGEPLTFDDPIIQVSEALNAGDYKPASEHTAILVEKGRTHLVLNEDKITLADHPHAALRVFASDEAFKFTVDEISQVWGAEEMEVDEFNAIWPAPAGHDWVLELEDEPDVVLKSGGIISFGPKGTEHIESRAHHGPNKLLVTVMTLSGTYPSQGAARVDSSELISEVLDRAKKKLKLTDTSDWVVSVNKVDIAPTLTFAQAGLSGTVVLDWMPQEGGGGRA
jgi:hypothetical protein